MLDNPEKTARLFTALKASVPFEATLSPDLTSLLARQQKPVLVRPVETVSDVLYLGDEAASTAISAPKAPGIPSSYRSLTCDCPLRFHLLPRLSEASCKETEQAAAHGVIAFDVSPSLTGSGFGAISASRP
jgi:hypothetical protein